MLTDAMILAQLRHVPASQIESAIALLNIRPRNEGVFAPGLTRLVADPKQPTVIAYAVTARMGVSTNTQALDNFDWYTFVSHLAGPRILCIAPAESLNHDGVLFGQMSARILARLGVTGAIVDGHIRDRAALEALAFPTVAEGTMLRHGVPHVAEYGKPIEMRGATIATGHIVAFDSDGALAFPAEILRRIPEGLDLLKRRTQPVLSYLESNPNPTPADIIGAQNEGKKLTK
ncbi:MAG: RraA family protein [Acidobacteria bacterium]|nr:RraA family protein [Acidobacteriota bacterium]